MYFDRLKSNLNIILWFTNFGSNMSSRNGNICPSVMSALPSAEIKYTDKRISQFWLRNIR